MNTYLWIYDSFDIELAEEDVLDCSHMGPCDADCERVRNEPYVREQLARINSESIMSELGRMGIEYGENDRADLESCIIWDAACSIRDDLNL